MNEQQFAFRILRSYALEICKLKQIKYKGYRISSLGLFNDELIKALSKNGYKYCDSIVENMGSSTKNDSKRYFSWSQAQLTAEVICDMLTGNDEIKILEPLLIYFLSTYDQGKKNQEKIKHIVKGFMERGVSQPEEAQADAYSNLPVMSESNKTILEELMNKIQKIEDTIVKDTHSDLPQISENKIILKDMLDELEKAVHQKKFVFLSGDHGSGKNFIAKYSANKFHDEGGYNYAFHIDCHDGKMSYPVFIQKLLFGFHKNSCANLTGNQNTAQKCFCKNKSIIFIEAFDCIKNEQDQKNIIEFLTKGGQTDSIVLITSNERMSEYNYIKKNPVFSEIIFRAFSKEELHKLAATYNDKKITQARKCLKNLDSFAVDNSHGNPTLMRLILFTMSDRLLKGERTEVIIKDFQVFSTF